MNERMLELLVQSGLLINVSEHRVNELDPNIEKFAELIVGECARIVTIWSDEEPCSEGYDITPVYKMKQYFGVE